LKFCAYFVNELGRLRDNSDTADFLKPISRERQMAIKVVNSQM
jgi:hypothetical protein